MIIIGKSRPKFIKFTNNNIKEILEKFGIYSKSIWNQLKKVDLLYFLIQIL